MSDLFDFDGNGETSFEENMLGTMLVMGAFDEPETENDDDEPDDWDDDGEESEIGRAHV